jgi:hypothetical protein
MYNVKNTDEQHWIGLVNFTVGKKEFKKVVNKIVNKRLKYGY